MSEFHNRRTFLRAAVAAGAAWATADLVQVEDALAWSAEQAAAGTTAALTALTRAQADTLDAAAARILPAVDGRPGARDAGVITFIDRSLSTFNARQKPLYANGVTDLNRRAAAAMTGSTFATLPAPAQDAILTSIEPSPFFQALRFDTLVGTFALPTIGANKDHAGWQMIGFEHQPRFQPPFGFYDADANRRG